VKIFLDAAPEVRGLRRYDQLVLSLRAAREVIRDLRARDERDRNRADSPLKAAQTHSSGLDEHDSEQAVQAAEVIVTNKLQAIESIS